MSRSTILRRIARELEIGLGRSQETDRPGGRRLAVDAVQPRRIADFRAELEIPAGGARGRAAGLSAMRDSVRSLPWVRSCVDVPPRLYLDLDPVWLVELVDAELTPERRFGYAPAPPSTAGINLAFCSPNANKPLHLGHARNMLLGSAIANLFEVTGVPVYRSLCLSDYGVHMFKALSAYLWTGRDSDPVSSGEKGDHFVGRFYAQFCADPSAIESGAARPRELARLWMSGSEEVRDLTRRMAGWAEEGLRDTFAAWGVEFDRWFYETEEQAYIDRFIEREKAAGTIGVDDEGRLVVELSADPAGAVALTRSDGTPLYMSHMVAAILQRMDHFGTRVDTLMSLTGEEQVSAFARLDQLIERFGYGEGMRIVHLTNGLVYANGRRLSSREGTALTLDGTVDLLARRFRASSEGQDGHTRARRAMALYLLGRSREKALRFSVDACLREGGRALGVVERALRLIAERPSSAPETDAFPRRQVALGFDRWLTTLASYPLVIDRAVRRLDPAPLVHLTTSLARGLVHLHEACGGDWATAPRPVWKAAAPAGRVIEHALCLLNLPGRSAGRPERAPARPHRAKRDRPSGALA